MPLSPHLVKWRHGSKLLCLLALLSAFGVGYTLSAAWAPPVEYAADIFVQVLPPTRGGRSTPDATCNEICFNRRKEQVAKLAVSPAVLEQAIQRIGLSLKLAERHGNLAHRLSRSLRVDYLGETDILRIRLRGTDRAMTEERMILDAIAQAVGSAATWEEAEQRRERWRRLEAHMRGLQRDLERNRAERDVKIAALALQLQIVEPQYIYKVVSSQYGTGDFLRVIKHAQTDPQ